MIVAGQSPGKRNQFRQLCPPAAARRRRKPRFQVNGRAWLTTSRAPAASMRFKTALVGTSLCDMGLLYLFDVPINELHGGIAQH